jgi:tetratricopeptide (TPR) repeat protein
MRNRNLTPRRLLTVSASVSVVSALLYIAGGCAGKGTAARDEAALDSYVKGVLAYQQGDTRKAMTNLQDAVNKKDDLVMARSMLGDLYRSQSDYESAKVQYQALAQLDPYYYLNHYRLGVVYQFLKEFQNAAASYLTALNLKPTDAMSNMNLALVYYTLDRPKEALPYAQIAVECDPQSYAAWVNLGLVLDANGDYAKSENAYRKAIDIDSSQPLTRLYLAESLMRQKKFGQARSVLAELVRIDDDPVYRQRYGDAFAGDGNYADAINQYRAVLKLSPDYFPALNEIGACYIKEYEKGLTLDDSKRKAALEAWNQSLAMKRNQADIAAKVQQYSKAPMFQP